MNKSAVSGWSRRVIWIVLVLLGLAAIAMVVCPCCFFDFEGAFYCYEGKLRMVS